MLESSTVAQILMVIKENFQNRVPKDSMDNE